MCIRDSSTIIAARPRKPCAATLNPPPAVSRGEAGRVGPDERASKAEVASLAMGRLLPGASMKHVVIDRHDRIGMARFAEFEQGIGPRRLADAFHHRRIA